MKKQRKLIFAFMVSLALVVSLFSGMVVSAEDEDETITYSTENYTFVDTDGNTISPVTEATASTTSEATNNVGVYSFTKNSNTLYTIIIRTSGTFTLKDDLNANIVIGGWSGDKSVDVTIDLNGYTLTRDQEMFDNYANSTNSGYDREGGNLLYNHGMCSIITVNGSNAAVTLIDSSENETGNVTGGYGTNYRNFNSNASADSSAYYGGGVLVIGGTFTFKSGNITSNGYDNQLIAGTGHPNNGKDNTWLYGTGVFVYDNGTFNLAGGHVDSNNGYDGAGVWVYTGTLDMTSGTIDYNRAYCDSQASAGGLKIGEGGKSAFGTISGGSISYNYADKSGGGVYVVGGTTLTMNGGTIACNTAGNIQAKPKSGGNDDFYLGGGVAVNYGGTFILEYGTISNNSVYGIGGGVGVGDSTSTVNGETLSNTFTMTGGTITNNTAEFGGGGVAAYTENATVNIKGGSITSNSVTGTSHDYATYTNVGGGIYILSGATLNMSAGTISDNTLATTSETITSDGNGGGVYVWDSSFTMTGGTIENETAENGAGVYVVDSNSASEEESSSAATFTMSDGSIINNTASSYGGAIYVTGNAEVNIKDDATLTSNSASIGGGIYAASSKVTVSSGVLANNTASTSASDVYADASATLSLAGVESLNKDVNYTPSGVTITGWFKDTSDSRYNWKTNLTDEVTSTASGSDYDLIAAHSQAYTVTYTDGVDDEEIFVDESYNVLSGSSLPSFSEGTPTREGYTFLGWSIDGETVLDLTDVTVTGDVTYIAVWQEEVVEDEQTEIYTVTYTDGVDDEEVFEDQGYTVSSGSSLPDFNGTPTREGYTFLGWSIDGETVLDLTDVTVTGDVTYIAVWQEVVVENTAIDNDDYSTTEEVDTDTSDHTAIFVYALLGLGALTGAYYVTRRRKEN